MGATRNQFSPRPWQSLQDPNLHSGVVNVTGASFTVDLGIGHNQFVPTVSVVGSVPGVTLSLTYGTKLGTFTIFASAPTQVSFNVIADSSVG